MIDNTPTILRKIHGNVAMGAILKGDFALVKCYVVKGGGFFAHGETLHEAQDALQEKIMESMPVEERIAQFVAEFKPEELYPAAKFYEWHHILTGSCEMGRREFAREHEIDIDNDQLTPEEFLDLTKDAYGSSVIRDLIDAFNAKKEANK